MIVLICKAAINKQVLPQYESAYSTHQYQYPQFKMILETSLTKQSKLFYISIIESKPF